MTQSTLRPPLEVAVARTVLRLAISLVPIPLLLLVDRSSLLATVTVHLSALVAAGIVVTVSLQDLADAHWFPWTKLGPSNRSMVGAAMLVSLVTGYTALITLASSAALRFDPSLQFLQLLSALDIAWASAALLFGIRWMAGNRAALIGAGTLGTVCVWSIWNYLRVVGFDEGGGWIANRDALMQYVLPFDVLAAAMAILALWIGSRKVSGSETTA